MPACVRRGMAGGCEGVRGGEGGGGGGEGGTTGMVFPATGAGQAGGGCLYPAGGSPGHWRQSPSYGRSAFFFYWGGGVGGMGWGGPTPH